MEADDQLRWESIKRGLAALAERPFQIPRLTRLRGDLTAANKEINDLYMAQMRENTGAADGKEIGRLRDQMRKRLLSISTDAKVRLEGLPGVKEYFHVPHKRTPDAEMFKAAERVLQHAKEREDVFIEGGFRKDFVRRAQASVDALKDKLADGNTSMNRRSHATHHLPDAIGKGRDIMRSITMAVNEELEDNKVACARWARAMRVPQKVGRPKNNRRARHIYPPPDDDE